jgi:hypothetical protein
LQRSSAVVKPLSGNVCRHGFSSRDLEPGTTIFLRRVLCGRL